MRNLLDKALILLPFALALFSASGDLVAAEQKASQRSANAALVFERAIDDGWLRSFMTQFPKGGDLHNHLTGAIYAETWLDWAVEDGLCIDVRLPAIREPETDTCEANGWITAEAARADENTRRNLIDGLSLRSFVPYAGWSGHDQFFVTFERMARKPGRLGDMLAAVAERAGHQNILYLELMETPVLGELFPLVGGLQSSGDAATDLKMLQQSKFGSAFNDLSQLASDRVNEALAKKDRLLKCGTAEASPGCDVKIKFIYQVIRTLDPANVAAQIALGWDVISSNDAVVGINLVAPEDYYVALRDYNYHMQVIDHLYRTKAPHNVTLHAGELTLGLVRPKQLRFHIRNAIEIAHAKRIGHGIDIPYEKDNMQLLAMMREQGIMVEINLTSNDTILGVKGREHPLHLYRRFGVPYALSTDDEGVSRIDLTHEYMRAALEHNIGYRELQQSSRNSLTYSFIPGTSLWDIEACVVLSRGGIADANCLNEIEGSEKAQIQWELEKRFRNFAENLKLPKMPITRF